jgi:hypothetical protein
MEKKKRKIQVRTIRRRIDMEYWEREEIGALERAFTDAFNKRKPDFKSAKELLFQGVDINSVDGYCRDLML